MYGGAIEPLVSRRGECHVFGFVASFLDDGLVPDETPLLEQAAQLLGELLLQPATRNGRLKSGVCGRRAGKPGGGDQEPAQ